ncbi:protein kinase [Streptomyces sp. NPDC014894]|uniref:protein kinase n=1 Tax=Streptomyces sp. NPDC014894 TaxID=3364931 RepID=UPI0036FBABF5
MDEYAGRVLADRYRLPLPPADAYELVVTRAFDTYSGQEVLVRQVPLPEIVEAEVVDADGMSGPVPTGRGQGRTAAARGPADPAVQRAVEAAQAAAQIPDHPRLDQVFDVFAEAGSLWIVSERVAARPLAALLAEQPLTPYRAAEVASDVLTALLILHAHGWTHRNITTRTVLVCDDGRIVLTGLAAGAAEEALCGYAPVPQELPDGFADELPAYDDDAEGPGGHPEPGAYGDDADDADHADEGAYDDAYEDPDGLIPGGGDAYDADDDDHGDELGIFRNDRDDAGDDRGGFRDDRDFRDGEAGARSPEPGPVRPYGGTSRDGGAPDLRAARTGAIAAYRAGAGAARSGEEQRPGGVPAQGGQDPDWWARKPGEPAPGPARHPDRDPDAHNDDAYNDDDAADDGHGEPDDRGHGHARLAGTWHDSPFPGRDGPPPLPAGGGFLPAEPRALPAPRTPRPLSGGEGPGPGGPAPATAPYRESDPYGVRRPAAVTGPAGDDRAALPARRSGGAPAPVTASAAAGGWDRGGAGREALRADARRKPLPDPVPAPAPGRWDDAVTGDDTPVYRGPATPLAAERARQARIAVVGAVTERWAPEQAGPVHENWQLAAPVGPATDLWALGALLYRAVQGHAPYPEENAAELVQLVCSEPPAFAEECGPLRPVVESLLRQDPTERPDVEELRGWLRSLVRSAPEPEAGVGVVPLPPSAADASRLPVVRRRGELVRRRRRGSAEVVHGRHRHKKPRPERRPRSLGRVLLLLILLLMAGAIAYAMMFMPKSGDQDGARPQGGADPRPTASKSPDPERTTPAPPSRTESPGSRQPQTSAPAGNVPEGFAQREDPEGFRTVVDKSWQRRPINDIGQIRYSDGDFTLIVVPGRDSTASAGEDPLTYQSERQRELQPYRDSSWAEATGLRRIQVGQRVMAEGQYSWQDANGRQVYVRNLVMVLDGRYHIVQVIGPDEQRDKVTAAYRAAADSYRPTR